MPVKTRSTLSPKATNQLYQYFFYDDNKSTIQRTYVLFENMYNIHFWLLVLMWHTVWVFELWIIIWVMFILVFIQCNGSCAHEIPRRVTEKSVTRSESCPSGCPSYIKEVLIKTSIQPHFCKCIVQSIKYTVSIFFFFLPFFFLTTVCGFQFLLIFPSNPLCLCFPGVICL